jgi:hypothetical protein
MRARRLTALGLFAMAAACDRAPPLSPIGPASPTATALTIAGADAVLTGVSTNYTAAATMSDGSTRTITPVWTTSNPAVASVDGAGRTEGLAHGATTLTATYQERSVSKTVQVVNDYGGTWEGRYLVTACRDTGELSYLDGGVVSRRSRSRRERRRHSAARGSERQGSERHHGDVREL